jgi:uncharacterized tellurite resistance protein B-like protein
MAEATGLDIGRFDEAERVAYATIVGSMAAADHEVASEELQKVRELCARLQLPEAEAARVVASVQNDDHAAVEAALDRLKSSELRFALLADCLLLARADDRVTDEERAALHSIAATLGIAAEQVEALDDLAQGILDAPTKSETDAHSLGQRLSARLASVGIPTTALALGTAAGLELSGAATGFAALAGGLGVATGFGAAVGLGLGAVASIRWLHKKATARPGGPRFRYQDPSTPMTLREGLAEYHSSFDGLVDESKTSSPLATEFFHHPDLCHVLFGCDTSLQNEGMVDLWTIFGTDVSVRQYMDYLNVPEAKQILEEAGFVKMTLETAKGSPKLFEVFLRARDMKKKWIFLEGNAHLDRPLSELRAEYGIRIF